MNSMLETFEWDSTWLQHTEDHTSPRVLYIGDSISQGTRGRLNALCAGKIHFDGYASSKALDNAGYFPMLTAFAAQQPKRDAILFNNGLHGYHLDENSYEAQYEVFVERLQMKFPDTPLYLVLSTFSTAPEFYNDRIVERNRRVRKIAAKKGLHTIDQYAVTKGRTELHQNDQVHFTTEGYTVLAESILAFLKDRL